MNYAEHIIVENWKDVPTEEIIEIKKAAKKLAILNTEWIMFYFFMFVFTVPTFALMLGNLMFGLKCFSLNLVIYAPIWFFYLRSKFINKNKLVAAKERFEEMETVLKYR